MKKLILLTIVIGVLSFNGIVVAGAPDADIKIVATNPYSYEGKIVNLNVYFQKTMDRGVGLFLTGYMDLFSSDGLQAGQVVISGIPTSIVFQKGSPGWTRPYLITVKGLGLTHGENAFGGPVSAPHFQFIKIDWETANQKNDQIIRRKQAEEEARIRAQERIEEEKNRRDREEAEKQMKKQIQQEKERQENCQKDYGRSCEEQNFLETQEAEKRCQKNYGVSCTKHDALLEEIAKQKAIRARHLNPNCPEYHADKANEINKYKNNWGQYQQNRSRGGNRANEPYPNYSIPCPPIPGEVK